MSTKNCILCGNESEYTLKSTDLEIWGLFCHCFSCAVCGDFCLIDRWPAYDNSPAIFLDGYHNQLFKLSAFVKEKNLFGTKMVYLGTNDVKQRNFFLIDNAIKDFANTVSERIDRALLNLEKLSSYPGKSIVITQKNKFEYPLFYSENIEAVIFIIKTMVKNDFLESSFTPESITIRLAEKGWNKIYDLHNTKNKDSK